MPVLTTFINTGDSPDELVAVTSPEASQVTVSGTTVVPPNRNLVSTTEPSNPASPLVCGTVRIVLTTARPLRPGQDTPMSFQFRRSGQVMLSVPMMALAGSSAGPRR